MSAVDTRTVCKRIALAIEVHGLTERGGTGLEPQIVAPDTLVLIELLLAAWELAEMTEAPVGYRRVAKAEFRDRLRDLAHAVLGPNDERAADLMAPRTWKAHRAG